MKSSKFFIPLCIIILQLIYKKSINTHGRFSGIHVYKIWR